MLWTGPHCTATWHNANLGNGDRKPWTINIVGAAHANGVIQNFSPPPGAIRGQCQGTLKQHVLRCVSDVAAGFDFQN